MTKGIIYYTDSRLKEPLFSTVQQYISKAGLPITSASLKPLEFGNNEVVEGVRSYPTMVKEILSCLERAEEDYVFFCEHDVLYPESHFEFTPEKDNIFYYNENVWRWLWGSDRAIRHQRMLPLSCMCANREFALEHYRMRQQKIEEWGLDEFRSREPRMARKWGYEPGTKKIKRGGLTDDDFETWSSKECVIDVRHSGTFSRPKISKEEFKHEPIWWKDIPISEIKEWDLKSLFNF